MNGEIALVMILHSMATIPIVNFLLPDGKNQACYCVPIRDLTFIIVGGGPGRN